MPSLATRRGWLSAGAGTTWVQQIARFCRRRPLGAAGGILLLLIVLTAVFAPLVAPHDPLATEPRNRLRPPGAEAYFGTDALGRDQFSRIVYGARVSLYVGLLSVTFSVAIGTVAGIASAYFGGWADLLTQRLVDTLQGIPSLVLALMLVATLGASLNNVTLAVGISFLARLIRISRGQAFSVRQQDYVLAARCLGASHWRTLARHVAPNSLTPSIVVGTALLGSAIVTEAGLSFLGLGVPPPHSSWGRMLENGARVQEAAPWLTLFPGLILTLTVFGFNLFGDALRDSLDPRLRQGR